MIEKLRTVSRDIHTKEDLWHFLRIAMEIELTTIPVYLSALYSIHPGKNQPACDLIHSVVIEEMLHLTLAGNILNATGGAAKLNDLDFVPKYPFPLFSGPATVDVPLERFCPSAIETFLGIERPEKADAPPEVTGFGSIGQFYDGLHRGLNILCEKIGPEELFNGKEADQIRPGDYYGGAGEVIVVKVDTEPAEEAHRKANQAMEEIVEQGEGHEPEGKFEDDFTHKPGSHYHSAVFDGDELPGRGGGPIPVPAHYYRFQEIKLGKAYQPGDKPDHPSGPKFEVDWDAVYPMQTTPKMSHHKDDSEVYEKMLDFNRTYMKLLDLLQASFTGQREELMKAVGVMYDLKYKAQALMKIPFGDGAQTVGASWEYVAPGD